MSYAIFEKNMAVICLPQGSSVSSGPWSNFPLCFNPSQWSLDTNYHGVQQCTLCCTVYTVQNSVHFTKVCTVNWTIKNSGLIAE